jgi:hypothetical protein
MTMMGSHWWPALIIEEKCTIILLDINYKSSRMDIFDVFFYIIFLNFNVFSLDNLNIFHHLFFTFKKCINFFKYSTVFTSLMNVCFFELIRFV